MRSDMKEVLITPGRRGSAHEKNREVQALRRKKPDDDEIGGRRGMLPKVEGHRWEDRKIDDKGDFLAPLFRYLEAQVGRPWDDVYSEICKNNPKTTTVGLHIYTHLNGYVCKNPYYENGQIYGRYNSWISNYPMRKGDLYVDQEGILRAAPEVPKVEEPKRYVLQKIDDLTFLVQNKKGIWFEFKYSDKVRKEVYQTKKHTGKYDSDNRPIYLDVTEEITVPVEKQINCSYKDYELIPYTSSWETRTWWRRSAKASQSPYLISIKALNKKQKRYWGLE